MKRLLPYPRTSAALLVAWLLLHPAPGLLAVAGGLLLAAWLPRLWSPLRPAAGVARAPRAALRLAGRVARDIVRSNIAVAGVILRGQPRRSGFVHIPLALRDPGGLAVLACIISSTPGTVWASHDARLGVLLIHVFDLADEATWQATIKGRYESLLLEIFP